MKKIFYSTLFTLFALNLNAQSWETMNSPNMNLRNIATMGDTVFVADKNNLYISRDMGANWDNINAPEWGAQSTLTDVAVVKNRIFVTIYTFGTFMSEDLGKTWARYESGMGGTAYSAFTTGDNLIIATDKRAFLGKALSKYADFKKLGKAQSDIYYAVGNEKKVCAVTFDNQATLFTLNNGKWEILPINQGLPVKDDKNKYLRPWNMDIDANGNFIVSFNQNWIYRLNETTKTWEKFTEQSSDFKGASVTALVTKDKTTWIGTSDGGIYRTEDAGATFSGRLNGGHYVNSNEMKIGTKYIFAITNYGLAKGGINLK